MASKDPKSRLKGTLITGKKGEAPKSRVRVSDDLLTPEEKARKKFADTPPASSRLRGTLASGSKDKAPVTRPDKISDVKTTTSRVRVSDDLLTPEEKANKAKSRLRGTLAPKKDK